MCVQNLMCSQTDYASLFCFCRPVAATYLKHVMTPMPLMTSSPVVQSQKSLLRGTVFPSLQNVSPVKTDDSETDIKYDSCKVTIQVHWPSKVRQKTLDQDLSSLGKMLCRGTFKQIARAAWRCTKLQQHFLEEIARQIHSECSLMCKTKYDGKRKREHEASHGLPPVSISNYTSSHKQTMKRDDMFNYQSSFLEIAILVKNFLDAISEGDGARVVRC